ncbi:reverse transcriptase [Gossypium australe]|uniref:Reverse transcriptase n=1 Tax=Gossypium australe TaxID=47621 RepID=A0A5B6WWW7_9ROSI|nr:reverse transcriptase [Gossypium australe]
MVSYSVVLNGQLGEVVHLLREFCQRDPLSPYIFLICGEILSSLLRLAQWEGILHGTRIGKAGPHLSHLFFVDDSILFEEATASGAHNICSILRECEAYSGQQVNFNKPLIYFVKISQSPNYDGTAKKSSFLTFQRPVQNSWNPLFVNSGGKVPARKEEFIGAHGLFYVSQNYKVWVFKIYPSSILHYYLGSVGVFYQYPIVF